MAKGPTARSPSGNDINLTSPSYSIVVVPGYGIYHQVTHREVSWLDRAPGPRGRGLVRQRLLEEIIDVVLVVQFVRLCNQSREVLSD